MAAPTSEPDSEPDSADDSELDSADHAPPEKASAATVDPAIMHWLDFFHRYHHSQDLRPVTLSMEPAVVAISAEQSSRYVFEVAVRSTATAEEWLLLAWEIDVPGIRIRTCDSREDAMDWFGRREIYGPKVATVRLSAAARPW